MGRKNTDGVAKGGKITFQMHKQSACVVGNDSNGWTKHADQCINITWNKYSTSKYGQGRGMSLNQPIKIQEQKIARTKTLTLNRPGGGGGGGGVADSFLVKVLL